MAGGGGGQGLVLDRVWEVMDAKSSSSLVAYVMETVTEYLLSAGIVENTPLLQRNQVMREWWGGESHLHRSCIRLTPPPPRPLCVSHSRPLFH